MYRYIKANLDWNSLSAADQMAVERANQYLLNERRLDIEDAVRMACDDIAWGNAEPEYEDEDFYQEEPDYSRVLDYMKSQVKGSTKSKNAKTCVNCSSYEYNGYQIYYDEASGNYHIFTEPKGKGRMDFESDKAAEEYIDGISDIESAEELKTYNVYFKDEFYGQVDAESENDAFYQYEDVIPLDELATVDPDYIPDYVYVVPADEDDIEGCDSIQSDTLLSDMINPKGPISYRELYDRVIRSGKYYDNKEIVQALAQLIYRRGFRKDTNLSKKDSAFIALELLEDMTGRYWDPTQDELDDIEDNLI